jgi:hypothetical protein
MFHRDAIETHIISTWVAVIRVSLGSGGLVAADHASVFRVGNLVGSEGESSEDA